VHSCLFVQQTSSLLTKNVYDFQKVKDQDYPFALLYLTQKTLTTNRGYLAVCSLLCILVFFCPFLAQPISTPKFNQKTPTTNRGLILLFAPSIAFWCFLWLVYLQCALKVGVSEKETLSPFHENLVYMTTDKDGSQREYNPFINVLEGVITTEAGCTCNQETL